MTIRAIILGAAALAATNLIAVQAYADSCWWHNGSLMRLESNGSKRWFTYERAAEASWQRMSRVQLNAGCHTMN